MTWTAWNCSKWDIRKDHMAFGHSKEMVQGFDNLLAVSATLHLTLGQRFLSFARGSPALGLSLCAQTQSDSSTFPRLE